MLTRMRIMLKSREFVPPTTRGVTMKVLIADDSALLLLEYLTFVEELGHQVTTANSGNQAITILRSSHHRGDYFDAVITDTRMPNGDGLQLLEAMETLPRRPPCLLQSSVDTFQSKQSKGTVHKLNDIGQKFRDTWFHLKPIGFEEQDLQYLKQFLEEVSEKRRLSQQAQKRA